MRTLTATETANIKSASAIAVQAAAQRITPTALAGHWITATNAYHQDAIATIYDHSRNGQFAQNDLHEYVAASAPNHCLDGWAYWGRALHSLIQGDTYTTVHLAYYAELRAAMSILAAEGIGAFNRIHVTFDQGGSVNVIGDIPTHDFVWQALGEWSKRTGSGTIIGDLVSDGLHPLSDWLEEFGSGYVSQSYARQWMQAWSLDLQQSSDDRLARNVASYRPTVVTGRLYPSPIHSSKLVRETWSAFEPDSANGFAVLDRYLIRLAFEDAFFVATGATPLTQSVSYGGRVATTIGRLRHTASTQADLQAFMTRSDHRALDLLILSEAAKQDIIGTSDQHLQIVARAALLLRIATGVCKNLLRSAGYSSSDLASWGVGEAQNLGLVRNGSVLTHPADMWADVVTGLEELKRWEADPGSSTATRMDWFADPLLATPLLMLGGCERIALWGLGSRSIWAQSEECFIVGWMWQFGQQYRKKESSSTCSVVLAR